MTCRLQRMPRWLVYAASLLLVLGPATIRAQEPAAKGKGQPNKVLQAGAATSNITPNLGALIVGNFVQPEAKNVHDELHVRCLVLDNGETQLAFAICDNVGIPRSVFDLAKRLVEREAGIPASHVLMAATHTHSGPSARGVNSFNLEAALDDYQLFVARRIADGVRRAKGNLQPAKIGWGSAQLPGQVFNRRWLLKPGTPNISPFGVQEQAKMNPGVNNPNLVKPAGPVDPEISFISVKSQDDQPIALLANYSLHYVGGVPSGVISADYFGVFAERMSELLSNRWQDPPFVGILTNGTSGDVNNVNVQPKEPKRYKPYEKMKLVAFEAADAVMAQLSSVKYADWVPLAAEYTEIPLAVRKPNDELIAWAKEILAKPMDAPKKHSLERNYAQRTLDIAKWPDQIACPLQAFRIGDLGVTAIPFEVFTETGLEIKDRTPLAKTFTIELANGAFGYLPTRSQHALGGYETWLGTNRVEVEAAHKIADTLIEMLEQLKKAK